MKICYFCKDEHDPTRIPCIEAVDESGKLRIKKLVRNLF